MVRLSFSLNKRKRLYYKDKAKELGKLNLLKHNVAKNTIEIIVLKHHK